MKRLSAVILILLLVIGLVGFALAEKDGDRDKDKGKNRGNPGKGIAVGRMADFAGDATIWTDKASYRVGENVRIGIKASKNGYAAIYDYPASGPAQMIWPRNGSPALIKAGRTYSVPDGQFELTASEPLGTDRLVLVVSRARANLTVSIDLSIFFGLGSRGLTNYGEEVAISSNGSADGESIYAECSFQVAPRYAAPVLRIYGGAGATLFVDGSDRGQLTDSGTLTFTPGTHEVIAFLPGMRAESEILNMRNNVAYDWSLRFTPVR